VSILDNPELEAMASKLGMGKADLEPLIHSPHHEAQRMLDSMKGRLRHLYRQAAFDIHPDRNPDDPDAARKFGQLRRVYEILLDVTVHPARREAARAQRSQPARPARSQPRRTDFAEAMRYAKYTVSYTGAGISFITDV